MTKRNEGEYGLLDVDALVSAAQTGDEDSVAKLYESLADRVYHYLLIRVSHSETAEDLTQTVFLEMIRSLPRYRKRQGVKFTTWLFQIARHRLIDHYRSQRPVVDIDDLAESHPRLQVDPDPPVETGDAELARAIEALPERQRAIIVLSFQEDLTPREVASVLGISVISVRVEKHRALKRLRTIIAPQSGQSYGRP